MEALPCTYPVINPLATHARPKICGQPGRAIAGVPYFGEFGIEVRFQQVCLRHACETATWRLLMSLPQHNFSPEEIDTMVLAGANRGTLIADINRGLPEDRQIRDA